jgi:hypothetical protein
MRSASEKGDAKSRYVALNSKYGLETLRLKRVSFSLEASLQTTTYTMKLRGSPEDMDMSTYTVRMTGKLDSSLE